MYKESFNKNVSKKEITICFENDPKNEDILLDDEAFWSKKKSSLSGTNIITWLTP